MIIIAPYPKKLLSGKTNPKCYPYWKQLIELIDEPIVQVGVEGEVQLVPDFRTNLSIADLRKLVQECRTWIGVDSFFQHLCWDEKKPGIVLWGPSDPQIFGHKENINLLKDRKHLVENPYLWWEFYEHNPKSFVLPEEVIKYL